jgi:3-oxoadipate CoA-transferase beta subunit
MIRGDHLDYSLLGSFEVSGEGDLANWTTEDPDYPPGVGGAMDLAAGAKEVRVLCEHTIKEGTPRIRNACTYPLTAAGVVKRAYTNLAVLDIGSDGVLVRETVEGLGLAELQAKTEPKLRLEADRRVGGVRGNSVADAGHCGEEMASSASYMTGAVNSER